MLNKKFKNDNPFMNISFSLYIICISKIVYQHADTEIGT